MIKLIVGLGNPGRQYEKTRHNAGFLFVDHLANVNRVKWSMNSQFQAEVANLPLHGDKLMLLKPMTFMNRSGSAVGGVLRYYKLEPEQMLVVHDELDLAEGVVKMKRDGGHAGHNGLRDIISQVGTKDFYRLRMGIGRPRNGAVADYVLSRPSEQALFILGSAFKFLEENLGLLLAGDVSVVNNRLSLK